MIYDVTTNFNSGTYLVYTPDKTDVTLPVKGLASFMQNKIKIESSKLTDIENSFNQYESFKDDIIGIDIQNEDQYNRIKAVKDKVGIDDKMFDLSLEDLSNTGKILQIKNKVKRFSENSEIKAILEEQKKANKFLGDVSKIASMNEPLSVLAKKDFIEKYGNKKDKTYGGFELNIEDYLPIDLDEEIAKIAKNIEREYWLERDPNSPVGDGYIFVNKVSGVTENGREVFQRKIDMAGQSKNFMNNVKAYIAINSPETDYNDPKVYSDFITVMMEDHLGDLVVSTEIKKIEDQTASDTSGTGSGGTTKQMGNTVQERRVYDLRRMLESDPTFKDYDFSYIHLNWGSDTRLDSSKPPYIDNQDKEVIGPDGKKTVKKGTGDLIIPVINGTDNKEEIRIRKLGSGQKRLTLEEEYGLQQKQQVEQQQSSSQGQSSVPAGDLTVNNPDRKQLVDSAGITSANKGNYTQDGKWVYMGSSGKVVVIDDPVNLAENGFNLKAGKLTNGVKDYHLSRSTAIKAKSYHDSLGYDYAITEAGTDTLPSNFKGGHKSSKHYDGTTYDFFLRGPEANDPKKIFEAILKGSQNDLNVVFETKDADLHSKVLALVAEHNGKNPQNKLSYPLNISSITGNHFSVYDKKPVTEMIKPGQNKTIDYAGPGNAEYNAFVENNDLRKSSAVVVAQKNMEYLMKENRKPIYDAIVKGTSSVPDNFNDPTSKLIDWQNQEIVPTEYVQKAVSLMAQSKALEDYMIKNPDEVMDIIKFADNPFVQEKIMDDLIDQYKKKISNAKGTGADNFDEDELMVLAHHDGNLGYAKDGGRNSDQLLAQYGMNIEKARQSLTPTEYTLYKLAYYKASGKINDSDSIKQKISYIEATPGQYRDPHYAVNPSTPAIGKYQIMWSIHKDDIKKYLPKTNDPVNAPEVSKQTNPIQTQGAGMGRDSVFDPMKFIRK